MLQISANRLHTISSLVRWLSPCFYKYW